MKPLLAAALLALLCGFGLSGCILAAAGAGAGAGYVAGQHSKDHQKPPPAPVTAGHGPATAPTD